jgi:hypothetical protein
MTRDVEEQTARSARSETRREETEGGSPSRRRAAPWLWRIAQLLLIAAVTWGIYRALAPELGRLTWAEILRYRPAAAPLAISSLVLLAVYLAHAFLWRSIMVDLGIAQPTARVTVRVYFVASLGRYLPGKLWQLAGLAVLAARSGMPPGGAAAAALLGQLAFLTSGLIFLALLLPRWAEGSWALIGAVVLAAAALAGWSIVATGWGSRARDWLLRRVPASVRQRLSMAFDLAARIRPAHAFRWAVAYGLTWVMLGIAFTAFVSAFVPAAHEAARQLAGTIAASYLWGYLMVIAPAGIGVREVAMGGLLARIPGFPVGAALLIAVASRVWFTVAEILPLAMVPLLPAKPEPRHQQEDAEAP